MSIALIVLALVVASVVAFFVLRGRPQLPPGDEPESLPAGKKPDAPVEATTEKGEDKGRGKPAASPSEKVPEENPKATPVVAASANVEPGVEQKKSEPPSASGAAPEPPRTVTTQPVATEAAASDVRSAESPAVPPVARQSLVVGTDADRVVPPSEAPGVRAEAFPPAEPAKPVAAVGVQGAVVEPESPRPRRDLSALKRGLAQTRGGWMQRLLAVFSGRKEIDPALLESIEETLLTGDVGATTARKMVEQLRARLERNEVTDTDRVWEALREDSQSILGSPARPFGVHDGNGPLVVLMVGVNGAGKTTTIAKLAARYKEQGKSVLLAAGDTFRAAAVTQLEMWGRRVGVPVYKGSEAAKPSAVVFEAVSQAVSQGIQVVIADTAGRLQTKAPLMEELRKIRDACAKASPGAPHEILLVLDATTGQNAISQAREFRDTLDVTGIVLTKLDGTAKGGVILAVADEFRLPVRFIGVGEKSDDLREFDARDFVDALFARAPEDAGA